MNKWGCGNKEWKIIINQYYVCKLVDVGYEYHIRFFLNERRDNNFLINYW